MLDKKYTQEALKKFTKYVVSQSRANLTRKDKNVKRKLWDSVKGESLVSKNSIGVYFEMEEYGEYQDKGVKGKTSSLKAPNSDFRFGSGSSKNKGGLTKSINQWVRDKRIQFRQKEGKGVKGQLLSYSQTAFLITRSVYNKGIPASRFFSKPFEDGFDRLPDQIVEAYGLDVEEFLKQTIKK
tara:strand:- start:1369 stop:1914 length:546 start_codon:yes stop_codon:yes gene_type:complete